MREAGACKTPRKGDIHPKAVQRHPFVTMQGVLSRPCGATLPYQVSGRGIPVLLIAPGGMRSNIANWASSPYNPITALPAERFQVIAMDQRSAQSSLRPGSGNSTAKVKASDGWQTFMEDQIALLDHLGIRRCHSIGMCIGPSYQLQLLRHYPERFGRAVLLQPIGLSPCTTEAGRWDGLNTEATSHWFGEWAMEMECKGLAEGAVLKVSNAAGSDTVVVIFPVVGNVCEHVPGS